MKSKKSSLIYLTLLLVIGLQCKKEKGPETVETWGYIIDEVTQKPIDGAKVLFFNSSVSTTVPQSTYLMDSTYTDQNGFFKKKWTLLKGKATQMTYNKKGYYFYKDLKMNAIGDVGTLRIKPNINYRLYIKNVPPVREDDSLFVNISYSNHLDGYRSLEPRWFVGEYDTMVNARNIYDNNIWRIQYHFKDEDGAWHYYSGVPSCVPLDTCDIYIEF